MFYRAKRLIEIFCMSTSVLMVHMPVVYAENEISGMVKGQAVGMVKSQAQGAVQSLVSGVMNDSSNDNMLSSVTANAIGAMSTELKGYSSMAPDMVFGSAAGSTQMYSSMASVTEIEASHNQSTDLASIAGMLGSLGSNPIAGMVLSKVAPSASSALGNVNFISSQIGMMNTASNVVEKKVMNLNSEVVAYRMAAVIADTLVNGGLDNSKKQIKGEREEFKNCQTELQNIYEKFDDKFDVKNVADNAYKAIDNMIQAREETAPSLEGAKKTEMARTNFKTSLQTLRSSLMLANEQYVAEAATKAAPPISDVEGARVASEKAALCSPMYESTSKACMSLLSTLEKNESSGKAPNPSNPMKLSMEVSPEQDAAYNEAVARLGPHFDSLMLTPTKRAILWRLLADLSELAVQTHEIKQIEIMSNVFKTQQMLKGTEEMLKPASDSITLPTSESITTPPKSSSLTDKMINYVVSIFFNPAIAGVPAANKKMSATERIKNYKPDCLGKQIKGRCVPLMASLKTMHALATLDPSMRSLAVRIAKMGDDTNKNPLTLTPAEKQNIAVVAANKAKITTYLIRSDIIREDRARAERIASPNYKKITESFLGLLNTVTENVLRSRNMTAQKFLASYGGMPFSKTDANPAKKLIPKENNDILSEENAREIASDSMDEAGVSAEVQSEMPQKVYKIKDINTNKSASLFEIISHRYSTSFASELEDE